MSVTIADAILALNSISQLEEELVSTNYFGHRHFALFKR